MGSAAVFSYTNPLRSARCCAYQLVHHAVSAASADESLVMSLQNVTCDRRASGIRYDGVYGACSVPSYRPTPIDDGGNHGAALQMSCSSFGTAPDPCRWPLSNHDGPSA